jgi:hypothetical protein
MLLYGSILFIILYYNSITRIPSYFEGIFISLVAVSAFSFFAMIPFDIFENKKKFFSLDKYQVIQGEYIIFIQKFLIYLTNILFLLEEEHLKDAYYYI